MATRNFDGGCITLAANYNKTLDGFTMPKGAVYGKDRKGLFICYDYKALDWATWYLGGGVYEDMPTLKMWRKKGSEWRCRPETNATTAAIVEWFEEGKGYPEISWGEEKIQLSTKGVRVHSVTRHNFEYYEFKLPKGAIYGSDKKGIFICKNIRPFGYKNGLPRIELYRPVVGGKERKNTTKWYKSVEANATSYAVWQLIKTQNLQLDYSNEPAELAKRQDLRAEYGTVHYTGLGFAYRKNPAGASYVAYEKTRSLDELANLQGKGPVFTGVVPVEKEEKKCKKH